jgi:rhodanese-related sulfurtransferase
MISLYDALPRYLSLLLATLMIACLSRPVTSSEPEIRSPDSIEGVAKVDAEGLINLLGEMPDLQIIDSRLTANRTFGYIEGSISLSDSDTSCESLQKVVPEKSLPVLFYCNGPKCGRSAVAAKIALDCGYKQLYWFRGGIEEWREKKLPLLK